MYLYHMWTIYINPFYDARCWNSEKNNRQMIFLTDQNCWIADPEAPSFLSYDTGVFHLMYETKQYRYPSGCFIRTPILNISFCYHVI